VIPDSQVLIRLQHSVNHGSTLPLIFDRLAKRYNAGVHFLRGISVEGSVRILTLRLLFLKLRQRAMVDSALPLEGR
jgi:hypothetical protein